MKSAAVMTADILSLLKCSLCQQLKGPSDFHPTESRHGLRRQFKGYVCRTCSREKRAQYEMLPDSDPRIADGTRVCSSCKVDLPLTKFGRTRFNILGRQYLCRDCMNAGKRNRNKQKALGLFPGKRGTEYNREYRLNVSAETFKTIYEAQRGKCGICASALGLTAKGTCLDHNHETGLIRGILCSRCNLGIGHLKDDIALLRAAISYLEKHGAVA